MSRWTCFMGVVIALALSVPLVYGQSALEELARQRISQDTGIPANLIATLFITEGADQFILAFIYINEETLEGRLKPEIKDAIRPFVGQNALLVLVVPSQPSYFDPFQIFLVQGLFRIPLGPGMVIPITPDFQAGMLEEGAVSAGILLLGAGVDPNYPFEIHYQSYSTTFALNPEALEGPGAGGRPEEMSLLLRFILLQILALFLLPFLM